MCSETQPVLAINYFAVVCINETKYKALMCLFPYRHFVVQRITQVIDCPGVANGTYAISGRRA